MDGVYQCNRNRRNLNIPGENTSRKKTEVDFTVRQKEELLWDGTFEGKQWRFEKVKIGGSNPVNKIPTIKAKALVPNSDVDDENRPPHDGEYVGTIEVVVLRCLGTNKQPIIGNESSSDESSNVNEKDTPADLDGASDPQPESKSKSEYYTQVLGLDGGWDDWGPPPPPLDEPKMGRIEMTSENTGTWNPVGQTSKSSNGLEKTKRWDKRSESREHFISDFQKHGSPAGSQRGRSSQPRSNTDQENAPQLNLRGGGPGSYSIASSEAMRNWNRGPPAVKEWAQGDTSSKGEGGVPAAFDPWTANLPTGDFKSEAEAKPQTQAGAWGAIKEPRNKSGSKKRNKDSVVSTDSNPVPCASGESSHRTQGNNGDDTSENGGDAWGGARKTNVQKHDQWNAGSDSALARNDDWNNDSSWDAANNNEKKDDCGWDLPNSTSNGQKSDWGGDENNDTQQNGEWGATDDKEPEQNDNWGATTDNDAQQGNSWGGEIGQQADTWGSNNTKHVTAGAKDPEKVKKPLGNQSTASGEKTGSSLSFGNSRAKGPKLVSKIGSQGKPASAKSKAASIKSNKKPLTFDWLKPSLGKAVNASGSPIVAEKASVPGAWASPEASPKQWESKPVAAQVLPTFSISTLPKPKPYWSTWRNPNTITGAEIEEEQVPALRESEEPVYSIPVEVAQRNMMSHQVRPDRPAAYTHKRNKPKYMDTHENPYAVFLFKYRDKEIIEHMLETTISEPEVDEKARLASLSKQELIDELMKTKSKLSVAESDSSGQATFVKKLDEKLSKLETGKEDVPAIGDWVKTTSPTDGHGIRKAGASGTNDTLKENEGGDVGITNGRDKGEDKNRDDNADANASGGASWGVNGDSNGKSDWNDNGNGNGGNDWGAPNQNNGGEKKDDNGWSLNDSSGGGKWNNDNNKGADTKPAGDWDNNDDGTKVTGEWGNDHVGDQGGNSRDDGGGGRDGGWGENDGKKNKSNGNDDAGFENSWGADTGGGGW